MHIPVLFNEVIKWLDPKPGQKFIDATINGGGHGLAILEKVQPDGELLGIEWDSELLKNLESRIMNHESRSSITLVNDSYVNLKKIAEEKGFLESDGILFDLGMSSWHLDQSGRGFSFRKDEVLDMRFNQETEFSALEIVNTFSEKDLREIITEYGEEKFADRIAKNIVEARKSKIIKTTLELVEVIKNSVPSWYSNKRINPATKTFQALRIKVNQELDNIARGLDSALDVLKKGGRAAVISFHVLEDRIVKNKFRDFKNKGLVEILTKKAVAPEYEEVKSNPRARSAKLRVFRKL
ncbi:MAG: 16S rRNA (cytosine(1402)-N(4))-methyltransferase RsmH [Candidatus Yanofskybacteria bacterium]|nr:16S rRNA (cytosine(1402)-N(4))-methyltransferase RsmH [Candidatus Yanofskybacteria bacterium]